jgi:protein-tyrosine-phosphatase
MYVLAPNQVVSVFPYSVDALKKDNPQTSFPKSISLELLAEYDVFLVVSTSAQHDPDTQVAEQAKCVYNSDKQRWETGWTVRDKTAEELQAESEAHAARVEAQRAEAYRAESDPLFFKSQRGEATQQEWLDKVAEIKARYPA